MGRVARRGVNRYMCNEFGGGGHEENRPLEKPSRCKWENDIKVDVKWNGVTGFIGFRIGASGGSLLQCH